MNDQPVQTPAPLLACRARDGRVYTLDKGTGIMRLAKKREGSSDLSKRDRAKMKRALKRSAESRA